MSGQINRGTRTGEFIYNTCLQKDIINIVEIGTWNGQGSTKCIAEAIISRFDDSNLVSLESNEAMYKLAKQFWDNKLLPYNEFIKEKIKIIHGKIIEKEDLISIEELKNYKNYIKDWEIWHAEDLQALDTCKNVINLIPDKIDLLLLDGGEFSTLSEFNKLFLRSSYILLDDTNTTKCNKISNILLEDVNYKLIFNEQTDGRNGFMCFKKVAK
jgi:hypothetical protein